MSLEIAEMLEMEGKTGRILMVDSSPLFLTKWINHLVPDGPKNINISKILRKGIAQKNNSFQKDSSVLDLFAETTLDLQIEKLVEGVISNSGVSADLTKALFDSFENRFRATANADKISFNKLSSTAIILVKSETQTVVNMPNDYDLQRYCEEEVKIHTLDGDHSMIIYNSKLGELIESYVRF